jgi:hypothetical protein
MTRCVIHLTLSLLCFRMHDRIVNGRSDPFCSENRFDELERTVKTFHGVLGWSLGKCRQIKYCAMKITSKIIHFRDRSFSAKVFPFPPSRKLTSAWKLTSQRFHLIFNSCIEENFSPFFPSLPSRNGGGEEKSFSLTLPVLNISLCDENTNTYSWQKSFYLIIQSMFYKKLLLFLSYAWRIMFVFRSEIFHEEIFPPSPKKKTIPGVERSEHYEIFTESWKLHRKLLQRIEY